MLLPTLAAITIGKLRAEKRCLYLNGPAMVAGFRSYLAAAGLNVEDEVKKGALVLSSDQSHLVRGRFDGGRMLEELSKALKQALRDGFQGLWATGDMMGELGSEKNFEKLLQYEFELDEMLRNNPALGGICQYHRDMLPADAIGVAMAAHQSVYINETLARMNPFYRMRTDQDTPSSSSDRIDELLDQLQRL
jgi:hypothetical protein